LQPWFYFVFMDSRVLQVEQRSTAKNSELHVQTLFAATIAQIEPKPQGEPTLLAAHCLALFQDWYVKRWKYRAAKVNVDDLPTAPCVRCAVFEHERRLVLVSARARSGRTGRRVPRVRPGLGFLSPAASAAAPAGSVGVSASMSSVLRRSCR
jgi:hypothetical protein